MIPGPHFTSLFTKLTGPSLSLHSAAESPSQELVMRYRHSQWDVEHILLALLEQELKQVRHDGYAFDNEEFLPGLLCLAVVWQAVAAAGPLPEGRFVTVQDGHLVHDGQR